MGPTSETNYLSWVRDENALHSESAMQATESEENTYKAKEAIRKIPDGGWISLTPFWPAWLGARMPGAPFS